jgi:ice-binding like protein
VLCAEPRQSAKPNMNRKLSTPLAVFATVAVLMVLVLVGGAQGAAHSSARSSAGAAVHTAAAPTPLVRCGQSAVPLGTAGHFRVLAGATVTNTGATKVKGNLGVSPGAAVTGFPPGTVTGTIHKADTTAATAQTDLLTAYNNAMGRTNCPTSVAGNIGGQTLSPGLYKSTSSLSISSGDLTLSAHGKKNAVWIFQITTKFTTTSGRAVVLAGGAQAKNIFWVVGSSATLGTTSVVYGVILAHKSISMATGAQLHGRALAHIGAVTMAGNVIHAPNASVPTSSGSTVWVLRSMPSLARVFA